MVFHIIVQQLSKLVTNNFASNLEAYILSHDPKTSGDVERLEREYVGKISRGFVV
jgi:hypothetical protein